MLPTVDDPMPTSMGAVITELRDDADVAALVGTRVRANRPKGADTYDAGDARGAGQFVAFVVVSTTSAFPSRRVPLAFTEYIVRCYGATPKDAREVWGAVCKAMHDVGPRLKSSGLGIYRSAIVGGGSDDEDPDTHQPVVIGTLQLIATDRFVTV
jgi:hypothetical protein